MKRLPNRLSRIAPRIVVELLLARGLTVLEIGAALRGYGCTAESVIDPGRPGRHAALLELVG